MADDPVPRPAASDVTLLLEAAAADTHSPDRIRALADHLDAEAVEAIQNRIQTTLAADRRDLADAMLIATERAALLNDDDVVRAWARIGRGTLLARHGDEERAASLLTEAFEFLDAPGRADGPAITAAYVTAGDWLCNRALQEKNIARARELLVHMLHNTSAAGAAELERQILAKLLWLSVSMNDLAAAETHARRLIADTTVPASPPDEASNQILSLLRSTAIRLFEAGEDRYAAARAIARAVVERAGADGSMLLLLATAAFEQDDYAESLQWLDQLLAEPERLLPDYDIKRLLHRRALCLLNLARKQEAHATIDRAVQIAPEDPYLRFAAAQVLYAVDDVAGSVREYGETIRLCNVRLASATEQSETREPPRSAAEYAANMPVEDLRDFAIIRRSLSLHAAGDAEEASADLQALVSIGDDISRRSALGILAGWAEQDGRLQEALELLEQARAGTATAEDETELRFAAVLLRVGEVERGLDILEPLAHKSRQPERCIPLLDRLPAPWSGNARVLRLRGYAKTEAGWPEQGFADLDAAVTADPHDAQALYLRALARITFGLKPDQKPWNDSRTMRHIRESLDDLYTVLRLSPDHDDARHAIQWLVERAAANPEMYEIFSAGGSREGDLFRVFPALQQALATAWQANSLGFQRRFTECAATWREAVRQFDEADFHILAGRASLRLADACVRLLDLDQAAASLDRAERVIFLVNTPLSPDVAKQYEEFVRTRGAYQQPTLGRELEYHWIYDHAAYYDLTLAFIKANYRHRLGDVHGALDAVEPLTPVLAELPQNLGLLFGIEEVLWVVAILRDAGRHDEALRILDAIEAFAAERNRSFDVLYTRGLVHETLGELDAAVDAYERALAAAEANARPAGIAPWLQYAACLHAAGRHADARRAFARIPIDEAVSDRDHLFYQFLAGLIHERAGEYEQAIAAVEGAIAIVEERRSEIPDLASRRAWQGQQQNLFFLAVKLYAETGQEVQAWQTVEMARARTLLDELAGRHALSAEHEALIRDLETVDRALHIVERETAREGADDAAATFRIEAFAELQRLLEPQFAALLSSTEFTERDLDALQTTLHALRTRVSERESHLKDSAGRMAGAVSTLDEVHVLLRA